MHVRRGCPCISLRRSRHTFPAGAHCCFSAAKISFRSAGAQKGVNLDFLVRMKDAGLTINIHMSSSCCVSITLGRINLLNLGLLVAHGKSLLSSHSKSGG